MDQNEDHNQNDQDQPSDLHTQHQPRLEPGTASVGPVVIDTENPEVASGGTHRTEWTTHPDRAMVIETSRIVEPNGAFNSGLVMVPVPVETRESDHGDSSKTAQKRNQNGDKSHGNSSNETTGAKTQGAKQDEQKNGNSDEQKSRSSQAPSMIRTLVFAAAVALVCGVAGAAGFSYFFGPGGSGDQKSKGGDSSSSKNAGSNSDSGSSKRSSSSGNSASSENDSGSSNQSSASERAPQQGDKMAEQAWLVAVKELRDVQASEKSARQSESDTKAVLDFFKRTMLSAGRPGDTSLADAFWASGQGKDVTLRKSIDSAESQAAEFFSDRPTVEATVRELLGFAYLNLGEAAAAVKQYERALALREATQGASQPETSAVRNQLAVAYRMASRATEAARLFDRNLNSPAQAASLAVRGSMLLSEKKPVEAELKLRDCLTIRQKIAPDDWSTFDTRSLLGQALLDQNKFADAEPMIVTGYEGMKARQASIPASEKPRMIKALERAVKLYELWGKADQAMKWRNDLQSVKAFNNAQ